MLNRLLYQVGLLMAVATIGFTGFLIMERIRQIEAVRTGFWDNLAYTTSQADFEIARLINALAVPDDVQSTGARDEIFVRYEVALGRLVGLTEGDTGRRILANEAVRKTVLSIKEAMADLEQDIGNYPGLSPQEKKAVLSSLGSLSDEFHRATVTIASLGDQDQTDFYRSLADAARLEILMLLLILIAGALAFANALLERRRFLQLNLSLSDAVSDRTAALQATNKRLQAEVAERGQAEERYRSLVDHATEAIVVIDADHGTFIEVNPRAESLYGLPRNELIGTYGPQVGSIS